MVSGPSSPSEGFRWVPHADQPAAHPPAGAIVAPTPPRPPRRRWWWITAVVVVVVAVVAGAVLWINGGRLGGRGGDDGVSALDLVGTPPDLLVSFPLDRQPAVGWQLTPADIGLPPGFSVGRLFASTADKAYFVTDNCYDQCLDPMTFVYGIDTATGQPLYAPMALTGFAGGVKDCYGNGPGVGVCLAGGGYDHRPPLTWVLDLDRGAVTYSGAHDLYSVGPANGGSLPQLRPLGEHLGETWLTLGVTGKGTYGIGAHAEPTWFAPGNGDLAVPNYKQVDDIPPLTMGVSFPNLDVPSSDRGYRIISLIDGSDLTPSPPDGTTLDQATVYHGGFAYQYEGPDSAGVVFYDTASQEVGRVEGGRMYLMRNSAMPTILNGTVWQIYTAAGRLVTEIPANQVSTDFKTIGTKLYVKQPNTADQFQLWQQWDLLTGTPGATCNFDLGGGYVGSDGTTVLSDNDVAGTAAATPTDAPYSIKTMAIDWSTCKILWTGENRSRIWQVGTGLITRNLAGDLLTSLVPAP